jgi:integrase
MARIYTRQVPTGPRYDVRFKINGEHRTKTFLLWEDANRYKKKLEGNELSGLVIDPKGGERLFGAYADSWIETRLVKGKPLSRSTSQGYKALMRRHLRPAFGGTRLRQITSERVRNWYATTSNKSQDQAAKAYRLLRAILTTAVIDDLIAKNPCLIKGAGIEHPPERPMVDTEVVVRLADAIEPRLRALVLVVGFRTLRTGELLGLQRRDIDLLHGTIRVERQAQEITGQGRVVVPHAKTEAGTRTLSLPAPIADALRAHLDAYVGADRESWVFTRKTGLPLRRQDLSLAWKDACKIVGLKGVRLYDLRHHAGTVSARDPNVTLKELMVMMGHSSPRAALIYQHATAERDRTHADYLGGVITAATSAAKTAVVPLRP